MSNQPNIEDDDQMHYPYYWKSNDEKCSTEFRTMLAKRVMLMKLRELADRGVYLSQNYNMDSNLMAMRYEYAVHTRVKVFAQQPVIAEFVTQQPVITDVDHQFNEVIDSVEI
jgi:hypothetical protein